MRKRQTEPRYISISVRGDEKFRVAINVYAKLHGVWAGDIIRDAVDAYLGEDLIPYLALFPALSVRQNERTDDESAAD